MAKPLRSDNPNPPDVQFAHFGVLNDGSQSKSSLFTSITLNIVIAVVVTILSAAAKKHMDNMRLTHLDEPIPIKKAEEPPKPKIEPKPLPKPPVLKVEPPKIQVPVTKLPDLPKPPEIKMTQPVPVVMPAPPKVVEPPPAPRVVNLAQVQAASVPNNSAHPSAVSLGRADNPIAPSSRTSTTAVNLGNRGLAGMPGSNNGMGPRSVAVNLGSGAPGGRDMNSHGFVRGVKLGVTGGEGPMNSRGHAAGPVNLGQVERPEMPHPSATLASASHPPRVLYKPKPEYTAEATKLHIEGVVSVRIRVAANGAVQVLGVTSDLGHGLGESAIRAVEGTRFAPATNVEGRPVDWEGVVNVAFQLAG